jgi:DNA-binding GntR family transcriptional regulator
MFKPGERLLVEEIAEQLGVSLTPVRHAMQSLAAEGLIDIRPRSGTYVAQLSARDLSETCDIRCALECLAAEQAIDNVTEAVVEEFREVLAALARPIRSEESRKRHERENARFHTLLIKTSRNRRLADMYRSLNAHLQIARLHQQDTDWAARLLAEQTEHEAIVAALERRDRRALVEAVRRHIMRAKEAMTAGLPDDDDEDTND